jgi:thiol-disulfide isomerase/thioredoxin
MKLKFSGVPLLALLAIFGLTVAACTPQQQQALNQALDEDDMMVDDQMDDTSMLDDQGDSTIEDDRMMPAEGEAASGGEDEAMMEDKDDTIIEDDSEPFSYSGQRIAGNSAPLIEFNQADYTAALASGKTVFLYFYANWCPICAAEQVHLKGAFDELTTDGVIGFRVNYRDSDTDKNEENMARQYGITYQHTKVAVQSGQVVLRSLESWPIDRYLDEINRLVN